MITTPTYEQPYPRLDPKSVTFIEDLEDDLIGIEACS